jgi:hypothetical protein
MPAQYVKPYVKTNKSDYIDAEAIAEVVQRSNMRFVPIKTEEVYADHDFKLASLGAGFLAVHAAGDAKKHRAWKLIEPANPIVARHYSRMGVEHFKGET